MWFRRGALSGDSSFIIIIIIIELRSGFNTCATWVMVDTTRVESVMNIHESSIHASGQ